MVNIEVRCPQCDYIKNCRWKGKFITIAEEHRLQMGNVYVHCPYKNRRIYLNRPYMYKILKVQRYEPKDIESNQTTRVQATKRGKYSHKQRSEMRKRRRRERKEQKFC